MILAISGPSQGQWGNIGWLGLVLFFVLALAWGRRM